MTGNMPETELRRDHDRDGVISRARVVEDRGRDRLVILVANTKGGCGKTTLATNLVSHLASRGRSVSLLDLDPQESASVWLRERERTRAEGIGKVQGLRLALDAGTPRGSIQSMVRQSGETLVIDSPAGMPPDILDRVLCACRVVLVPVLPSPIDIRATTRFLQKVMLSPSYQRRPHRLAVVANRARPRTRVYTQLQQFLKTLKIPWLTTLRDTQYYARAAGLGSGVTELDTPRVAQEVRDWGRIMEWLEIQRQLIRAMPDSR